MFTEKTWPVSFPKGIQTASIQIDLDREELGSPAFWGIELSEKLHSAVLKRRIEYLAGRYCAQKAAGFELNLSASENGYPEWPEGCRGSITHRGGIAAAAVSSTHRSIGIDVENISKFKNGGLVNQVLSEDEKKLPAESLQELTALVFSAKESIYKCLFPEVRKYFGFQAAEILGVDYEKGNFAYTLKQSLNSEFSAGYKGLGSFAQQGSFVFTSVFI